MIEKYSVSPRSDKFYWHRYESAYKPIHNLSRSDAVIVEFGVLEGESIKWLRELHPNAHIYGLDILGLMDAWPSDARINYLVLDQADRTQIRNCLTRIGKPINLVIEDGSHIPQHQWNSLIESLSFMDSNGVYIVEDIHTSLSELNNNISALSRSDSVNLLKRILRKFSPAVSYSFTHRSSAANLLTVVLAMERAIALGRILTERECDQISSNSSYISTSEIRYIENRIDKITIYRRSTLPLICYRCKQDSFNLASLRCDCGAAIYSVYDSMTAVLELK